MSKTNKNKSTWLIPLLVVGLPALAAYFFFLYMGKIYLQSEIEQFLNGETTADSDMGEEKYEQFLNGEITALNDMGKEKYIEDFLEPYDGSYLYFDIDGDGQQELHICTARDYYILKYEKDALQTIYDGVYSYLVSDKNLCGILYERLGGAPTHVDYYFTSFQNGEGVTGPDYSWYDENENGIMDEEDWFFREDDVLDMDTWENETKAYRESRRIEEGWKDIELSGRTTQEQTFTEDSFRWEYKGEKTGIVIRLENCVCLYESDNFRIYSVYLDDVLPENSSYQYSGELLYLQTPQKSLQLYPDEYVIDEESGTIYILYNENDFFASIYCYCAATDATGEIWGAAFLKPTLLEEWIPEAHGLPVYSFDRPWARCSNLRVHMTGLSRESGEAVLRGEASGIYEGTGETYCIEWESDVNGSKEKLTPVTPKIYDEEKDKAVFEACAAAFDRIEQGDWSLVAGREVKANGDARQWRRMDINGDGLPELILEMDVDRPGISPILGIYTYVDGAEQPLKEVFSDLNDFTEYYFVGADGKLIYDYSDHGEMAYGSYSEYRYDEQWNHKLVDRIQIYYFYDHYKEYEGEHERFSENYPETYGARGSGYYYFRSRRRTMEELEEIDAYQEEDLYWVREEISREEFVRVYKEMTGLDFFRVNTGFSSE